MSDLTAEYLELEEILQDSKRKVLADMVKRGSAMPSFDGLDLRQKYAEATMGWMQIYDPENELPQKRRREIAARFWQYGKHNGFTEASFQHVAHTCTRGRARDHWRVVVIIALTLALAPSIILIMLSAT